MKVLQRKVLTLQPPISTRKIQRARAPVKRSSASIDPEQAGWPGRFLGTAWPKRFQYQLLTTRIAHVFMSLQVPPNPSKWYKRASKRLEPQARREPGPGEFAGIGDHWARRRRHQDVVRDRCEVGPEMH